MIVLTLRKGCFLYFLIEIKIKTKQLKVEVKKVNKEYGKVLDNIKAKALKEKAALKRKSNNAFNSPVKNKKLAKK